VKWISISPDWELTVVILRPLYEYPLNQLCLPMLKNASSTITNTTEFEGVKKGVKILVPCSWWEDRLR
jgi:hypothetical protein